MVHLPTLRLSACAAALAAVALALPTSEAQQAAPPAPPAGPLLIPHVTGAARALVPTAGQLFVHNPHTDTPLRLERMRVVLDGVVVEERTLGTELAGDARFFELVADIERLPHSITELQRPDYALAPGTPEVTGPDVVALERSIGTRLDDLRAEWAAGAPEPFTKVDFTVQLDQLLWADDPVGTTRPVTLELDWSSGAPTGPTQGTARVSRSVERLAPRLALPATLSRGGSGQAFAASMPHEHAGDLHVHSCRGEASGACSPSGNCGAETLQVSGSFSYAQLKSQFQALGVDWFTATDHSYCIDSASEYVGVQQECAALTDGSFLVAPDIELSSDEQGPQSGSDLGDAVCLGGTSSNHMGAHNISTYMHGGSEEFWGFCDGFFTDELDPFLDNIQKIRANGGFPIVNHPAGSSFAFNSVASLQGIEAGGAHGVEIWNGAGPDGQGGNVGAWIDWLEDGRILYGYSGSDTHDEAFAFGENRVLLEPNEAFNTENVMRALQEGRVYLSDQHVLVHEAELGGDHIGMGSLQSLTPAQQGQPVTLEAHYNFGTDTGVITFFGGTAGGSEGVLAASAPLTGAGVFTHVHTPPAGLSSWTRAYSEGGGHTAYTNPIFYRPSSAVSTPFGTGLGGTNTATLASASAPVIGASVELDLASFPPNYVVLLGFSGQQIPGGLPLGGGTLLIQFPAAFQKQLPTDAAGAASFNFRMPLDNGLVGLQLFWQAATVHPTLPGALLFSNGLAMPISG